MGRSRPFDIDLALEQIGTAVAPYPKAALFELAEDGFGSTFEQLVACIISIRTRDETMLPAAQALFARARTPAAIAAMPVAELDELIGASAFHERKAEQIQAIARQVEADYGGELPCDEATLLGFQGVGPKCANLVLGIACDEAFISVDVHVHRISNRWGYVETKRPEQTMAALQKKLPRRHWVTINRLLVPFGKHICTARRPRCSECPLLPMCAQEGVDNPR